MERASNDLLAVILARGDSSRMGLPKGLVKLPGDAVPFLQRIVGLYLDLGIAVRVVTLDELAPSYRTLLQEHEDVEVVGSRSGGGTATTVLAGWRSLNIAAADAAAVLAHPVDMPLVRPSTLEDLLRVARRNPHRVLRPVCHGSPGHPVVVPAAILGILEGEASYRNGSLQDFFARGAEAGLIRDVLEVTVADEGVIRDFDTPADLEDFRNRGGQ
jgi:CTP:molybdopterin cytidylyltransferase MocA